MLAACRSPAGHDSAALAPRVAASLGLFDRAAAPHAIADGWVLARSQARAGAAATAAAARFPLAVPRAPDGSHVLFEGRIDNAGEIAAALGASPHDMAELYGRAVAQWGDRADRRLIGDYAAILVHPQNGLRLARSPWRAPPILFCDRDGILAAASVARVIHACGLPRVLNRQRVADNLIQNLVPAEGWFAGIERVQRGLIVHLAPGSRRVVPFYDELAAWPVLRLRDAREYVEATDALLTEAVTAALRGIRRPAMSLSGGLDSPNVAARICRALPAGGTLRSYTFVPHRDWSGFVSPLHIADERPQVEALAERYANLVPTFLDNPDEDFDARLPEMFLAMDGAPIGLPNVAPLHGLYQAAAADGCDVMFNANLGNYSFSEGGAWAHCEFFTTGRWRQLYLLYRDRPFRQRSVHRLFLQLSVLPLLPLAFQKVWRRKWQKVTFDRLRDIIPLKNEAWRRFDLERRGRAAGRLDDRYYWRSREICWREGIGRGEMEDGDVALAFEQIHGLPTRDPTAYRPLIEFCRQIPTEIFVRDGVSRWLGREVGRPYLPACIVDERRDANSGIDWHWRVRRRLPALRAELRQARAIPELEELLDFDELERRFEAFPEEAWTTTDGVKYSFAVARAVVAARFVNWATGRNAI
ncbi:MAG TPA: asparagine synthase-related protein [Croceibacterium sp.]|nr:asparagine synthase-related protein [Croceibacterium sp.]